VTTVESHTEQTVQVAGLAVRLLQGGEGSPLVVLHHSTGNPGWVPFYDELAKRFAVTVPDLPGYGQSERPEWAREPRDIAILSLQLIEQLGLEDVTLVGLGLGGFIAAEMATMCPGRLKGLVLIGAAGIQPDEGEIYDQMMVDYQDYIKAGFRNDEGFTAVFGQEAADEFKQLWDFSREMTARITWKPYMFNRRLPHLLKDVQTPALLIWGSEDIIVPPAVGQQYAQALPNARLEIIDGAGHLVEYEEGERVAQLIAEHAAR
jgi:pimeloyl-ACP methyl ester carboxylesterase